MAIIHENTVLNITKPAANKYWVTDVTSVTLNSSSGFSTEGIPVGLHVHVYVQHSQNKKKQK